jgi:hypothetical protein
MAAKQSVGQGRSPRTRHQVFIPGEDVVEAVRRELPYFESYDTRRLVTDAQKASLATSNPAEAVTGAYNKHCRHQVAKLLHSLRCDPDDPDIWQNAFLLLARLHHNVGRLVHRRLSGPSARSWTFRDEAILLCGVRALMETGFSARKAVNFIADNQVFPHLERRPEQRSSGRATRDARRAALWQKYQRLLRDARSTPDPWARALGLSASDYELFLARLDNPPPKPPAHGDNSGRWRGRVRKSPTG